SRRGRSAGGGADSRAKKVFLTPPSRVGDEAAHRILEARLPVLLDQRPAEADEHALEDLAIDDAGAAVRQILERPDMVRAHAALLLRPANEVARRRGGDGLGAAQPVERESEIERLLEARPDTPARHIEPACLDDQRP